MPNHITNILEFDCTPERFREIAAAISQAFNEASNE